MSESAESYKEELQREIERCLVLQSNYEGVGEKKAFTAAVIKRDIAAAQKAIAENDAEAIVASYSALLSVK